MPLLQRRGRRPEHFQWTRYWLPRGGSVEEDGGFLVEPGIERYLREANTHLRTLDGLDEIPCLVLLGDPSLGKSHEIEDYVARLAERQLATDAADEPPFQVLAHDVTEFDNRDQLRQAMFANDVVDGWRRGNGLLYLVLDSLDESLIEFGPLCDFLLDQLASLPLERCRLRVACRTSELPMGFRVALERQFRAAYGAGDISPASDAPTIDDDDADVDELASALEEALADDDSATVESPGGNGETSDSTIRPFAAVELAVLTRSAARVAAIARLGSEGAAERFLDAVDAADAQLFAARPLTLLELSNDTAPKRLWRHRRSNSIGTCAFVSPSNDRYALAP